MEKGWGLALENSEKGIGFFVNKPIFGFNLSGGGNKGTMFAGVDFPANKSRNDYSEAASSPAVVGGEVDFFSNKKITNNDHHHIVKKENSFGDEDLTTRTGLDVNTGLQLVTANTGSDQSTVDDGVSSDGEDKRAKNELAKLQIQLEQMHAENQRLRGMLTQVTNNYNALQMHIETLIQHNSRIDTTQEQQDVDRRFPDKKPENGGSVVPRQFMDLGPSAIAGEMSSPATHSSSEERTLSGSPRKYMMELSRNKMIAREESPESQSWAPNKMPKLNPSKTTTVDEATEATMRKARVSVRARSEAPMISDGCQWRKYGQKMAKGNPCPRAYYRCTMAVGCPVRKQVQRCAEDRSILITTYEGTHNHPLPPAAMAMASTTSAAVNMLLSGSMPSADGLMNPNLLARAAILSGSSTTSMATISASAPFPTVTLDLTTQTPNPLQQHFQTPTPTNQFHFPSMPQVFGQALHNQSKFSGLQVSRAVEEMHHQAQPPSQVLLADTLSAATAAITSDPNFTAALAAAITSIIGGAHPNGNNNTTVNNANISTSNNTTATNSFHGN